MKHTTQQKHPEIHKSWETDKRFYNAHLVKNVLGEWIIDRQWGGKFNLHRNKLLEYCSNYNEGIIQMENISKIRRNHKYSVVKCKSQFQ